MKYKCVKQFDTTDCAAACIATVALQYGKELSLEKVREQAKIDREGATIANLVSAAKYNCINAVPVMCENTNVLDTIEPPCIAHVKTEFGVGHYVVIHEVKAKKIVIADPSFGITKIDKKKFVNGELCGELIWNGILILTNKNEEEWRKNNFKRSWIPFKEIFIEKKWAVLLIISLSLVGSFLNIVGVFYYKILIDTLIPNRWIYTLLLTTLGFIIIIVTKCIINYLQVKKALQLSKWINERLSLNFYDHIMTLPMKFHDSRKKGDIISRFNDISEIQEILVSTILTVPVNLCFILTICFMIGSKNISILITVLVILAAHIGITVMFRRRYEQLNHMQMRTTAHTTSTFVENLSGIETIKAYSKEAIRGKYFKNKYVELQQTILSLGNVENIQYCAKLFIGSVGEIVILAIGGLSVMSGKMTLGELITINFLMAYLFGPFQRIIDLQPQLHTAVVALRRYEAINDIKVLDGEKEIESIESVTVDKVSFAHESQDIVCDINMQLLRGRKYLILGDSGSGKTTIMKLLNGLYECSEGKISYNETSISLLNKMLLRRHVIYVSQDDYIFSGSVKENVLLGKVDIAEEQIYSILNLVEAEDFVKRMPEKLDSFLDENGSNLSKGQKQRLVLARALLCNPQILLLDEATSNIDKDTEARIYGNLNKFMKDKILVSISHVEKSIYNADTIYYVKSGRINQEENI